MAKPRELKRRIRSVQNTRKITKTMELVSTSKLKRAQDRVVGARPYAQALAEVIGELYSPELAERFPHRVIQLQHEAEVDQTQAAVVQQQEIARVHVGIE